MTRRRACLTASDIDYEDHSGRVADFHALRHTFIFPLRRERYAGQADLARLRRGYAVTGPPQHDRAAFARGCRGQA